MKLSFFFSLIFFILASIFFPIFFSSLKNYIPFLLGLVMMGMGMTVELRDFKRIFKNFKWILTATFLQFSIMPILAITLSKLFNLEDELTLGFIILGSCPGGTASNLIAFLIGADVSLSISLTIISTIFACFLTPIIILILGGSYVDINALSLVKSTFLIVFLPVIGGIFFKRLFNLFSLKIIKILPKLSELTISLIVGIILSLNINNLGIANINFFSVVVLHNLLGLLVALIITNKMLYPKKIQKTIAIEVAMQNSGLGVALSLLHFNPMVALPSTFFSVWHNISAIILINFWKDRKTTYNKN